jgi:dihydropteroate synthase
MDEKEELDNAIETSKVKLRWKQDKKGYFTIKPFISRKKVFIRFYDPKNNLKFTFSGINTSQLMQEIINRKLVSSLEHASYLGKEIEKAIIALKNNLEYVQDSELKIK